MKTSFLRAGLVSLAVAADQAMAGEASLDPERIANTVVLDDTAVKNLRIESTEATESVFEQTAFALGRIEPIPTHRSGVSGRVPGRIVALTAAVGDSVAAGQEVAKLEARVPGNPPPVISLTAAAGGLVTKVNAALGEPLEPEATLLEITDLSQVYAVARVPEHVAGKMALGTTARIHVPASASQNFEGQLLRFAPESDESSATIEAVFKLENSNLWLRPGLRAEFSIVLSRREGVTSVPRSALQGDPANRFLFVKDFEIENAFVKIPVEVGEMNDRSVEIINGLLPGDEVVTKGAYSLSFAGGGTVSLVEALDAAHGHKHNPDGSEITDGGAGAPEDHDHDHEGEEASMFWKILSGILMLVIVGQAFAHRRESTQPGPEEPCHEQPGK